MTELVVIQSVYKNDRPDYLEKALTSILCQTYSDFVLYLGIDGPIGEELRKVIDSYNDTRIRIVEKKENKGLASILNILLKSSECENAEFVARMDSDDIAFPDRFEKQIKYLKLHQDVDLLGTGINEIDEFGKNRNKEIIFPETSGDCFRFFAKRNPVAHPTIMFRRRFFDKVGDYYSSLFVRNEDTYLIMQGFMKGAVFANIPEVLLNFRITDAMFNNRRRGKSFAKSQLKLRFLINKNLRFGLISYLYAFAMFILMISPGWILKIAYRVLR